MSTEDVDLYEKARDEVNIFKLWHGCEPMSLLVEGLHNDAADIGLTEERIRTLVESRLRVARLYVGYDELLDPFPPTLYVRVGMISSESGRSGAYNIGVSFRKHVI